MKIREHLPARRRSGPGTVSSVSFFSGSFFSGAAGALMVAAAARPVGPWALVALALAAGAVLAGVFVRQAAPAAVLLTVVGIALGDPGPLFAAVSGLSAAAYLVTRYAGDAVTLTTPTLLGMLGFTAAGVAATTVPVQLTWVPLMAPLIMAGILIVVVAPLVARAVARPAVAPEQPD